MATATYVPLATQTLGSATNTITFSSIPSGYTDLRLVSSTVPSATSNSFAVRINADSGTNYSNTWLYGTNVTVGSMNSNNITRFTINPGLVSPSTSYPYLVTIDFMSYLSTSAYKSILFTHSMDRNGSGDSTLGVGLWRSTSAITSITCFTDGGPNWNAGSTFTLWGI